MGKPSLGRGEGIVLSNANTRGSFRPLGPNTTAIIFIFSHLRALIQRFGLNRRFLHSSGFSVDAEVLLRRVSKGCFTWICYRQYETAGKFSLEQIENMETFYINIHTTGRYNKHCIFKPLSSTLPHTWVHFELINTNNMNKGAISGTIWQVVTLRDVSPRLRVP